MINQQFTFLSYDKIPIKQDFAIHHTQYPSIHKTTECQEQPVQYSGWGAVECFNTLIVISSARPSPSLVSWIDPALTAHRSTCGDWALHTRPPFSSSSFFLSLSSFFVILPTSSSWSTAYLVIEAHTGPPCSISLVLCYHLCPLIFVIHPLYMLLLCLSMLSSPPRSGKLSGYLLFM